MLIRNLKNTCNKDRLFSNLFCWKFEMMSIFVFSFVVLSCLPLIPSSTPTCPESFSCPNMVPFQYPFYNATNTRCDGLIKVNCSSNYTEIQLGNQSYKIGKIDYESSLDIYNYTFSKLVDGESCEALMDNFTSPEPLLYSISIAPFIILFKCAKNVTYFDQPKYNSHNRCNDYNFYYQYMVNNATIPSDVPHSCQVIQLPVKQQWQFDEEGLLVDQTKIFPLLYSYFSISFKFCPRCQKKGSQCHPHDGNYQCLDAKKAADKPPTKLILVLSGFAFIIMLSSVIFIIWRRHKTNPFSNFSSKDNIESIEDRSLFYGVSVFSYTELEYATQHFDPSNKLGDGGFGAVYYGKLKDGREVAVKKLYEHNYRRVQQFINEVEILTKLRHPNLVVLYGCTSRQSHELLVYEYIPNGTVSDHLHGKRANPSLLTWPIRMNIAIETANALVYLHANEIIHRDVKTNNILLDHNFCVKVADFGLSRLIPNNVTHVSTAPQGTPGYVDPQYHQCYQLTDKSDVYSFGVVLCELISSMVAVDLNRSKEEINLANLALNRIQRCAVDELIDPVLVTDSNRELMTMITSVAELVFRCLQYDSEMRPTMSEVLDVLMDIQAEGRTDAGDLQPSSETNDIVVLLKNFPRSPVSVTGEWQSENSASTTVSSSGDRSATRNR